ncbi:hypothetical protein E2C01_029334 [Portunus trituberculatus]|uniref:Uncharacterized protein n=1 Tax=Portunus trituberculatus TaxID=210409 RepID=A0A5B7ERJ8_PORTR|nr:hypothetical protein [Portunus trituberculatus]
MRRTKSPREVRCGGGNAAGCDSRRCHRTAASLYCRVAPRAEQGWEAGAAPSHPITNTIVELCTSPTRSQL